MVIGTAWIVRNASIGSSLLSDGQSKFALTISGYPDLVLRAIVEVRSRISGDPINFLLDRKLTEKPGWVRHFPAPKDTGYLLFSGVSSEAKRSVVQLIRIADGVVVARWGPNWPAIYQYMPSKKYIPKDSPNAALADHPLLLADGDLIFNTSTALMRLSPCSSSPVWALDEVMHHSVELDENGTAIWVPAVSNEGFADSPWLRDRIRDDALAHVSIEGILLQKLSFVHILRENGLHSLLLGTSGNHLNEDPVHINQIQVALRDSRHWRRGDLLISARHMSTIFLYRPATGKIIWHQTGPWMNQHNADFIDDHRISVFDNNVITGVPIEHQFITPSDINRVLIYDFDTGKVSQPFSSLLAESRPITGSAGRARVLPDGGLFVEETDKGRHLRFTRDRLLWSRVNDYDDQHIGVLAWSRYLTAEEASIPLRALASRNCLSAK